MRPEYLKWSLVHSKHLTDVPESPVSRTGEVRDDRLSVPPFNKHLLSILSMPSISFGPGDAKRRNFLPPLRAGNPDRGQGCPAETNSASRGSRDTAMGHFKRRGNMAMRGTWRNKAEGAPWAPSSESTEPLAELSMLTAEPLHGSEIEASF